MTFCAVPWVHRHTDEQGFNKLCCFAEGDGGYLRDDQGERSHISQELTNAQALNSPQAKAVRVQMMRGEWPAACERCRQAEQAGSFSARQRLNSQFGQDREALLRRTGEDGSLEHPIVRYVDIRLGNACNLSCRMCGPYASTLWARYFNDVQPAAYRLPAEKLRALGENNGVKRQPLAQLLDQCLPTVERLHFAAGEPLIAPEMVDVLERCISSGRAGEIELTYNTNLTVLPEKVIALWPRFRSVGLVCSVDGFGRLNDYIRRPSRWSDIDRNLRTLDRHFDDWNVGWAAVNATVQVYNALTIHDLFAYLRSAGFARIQPIPRLAPLFHPRYLSMQCLPAGAKAIVRERLGAEIERARAWRRPELAPWIESTRAAIAFMDAADTTCDLPDFFAFCQASDKAFGDSWRQAAPELAAHLEPVFRELGAA